MKPLTGISWGHRRATAPLHALARAFHAQTGIAVEWRDRTLADFEHQSIVEATAEVDLIVFDHPFCGDVEAAGALVPLDAATVMPGMEDNSFVGASLASYRYECRLWGAPIDAATMHAVCRADLMTGAPMPETLPEVLALGAELRKAGRWLALPFAAPHAGLALASMIENLAPGWQAGRAEAQPFFDRPPLEEALEMLARVAAFCPPDCASWNAIDLHEAMRLRDDLVYCFCTYGYATYGEREGPGTPLAFGPFAGPLGPGGAVLGGAGLGVTRRGGEQAEAMDFLRFAMDPAAQVALVAGHHGQPAAAAAWRDRGTDASFNCYFSAVSETLERSSVRPRWPGYITLQDRVGHLVAEFLADAESLEGIARAIRAAERDARATAGMG